MRGQQGRNILFSNHGTSRECSAFGKAARTLDAALLGRRPRPHRNLATNVSRFVTAYIHNPSPEPSKIETRINGPLGSNARVQRAARTRLSDQIPPSPDSSRLPCPQRPYQRSQGRNMGN